MGFVFSFLFVLFFLFFVFQNRVKLLFLISKDFVLQKFTLLQSLYCITLLQEISSAMLPGPLRPGMIAPDSALSMG